MTTISATSILASRHAVTGDRLDTLLLRYPRVIHSEFMTHRMFSRNAASSRAIPVDKLIKDVLDDPFVPLVWGANQKGMQAGEECDERVRSWDFGGPEGSSWTNKEAWLFARDNTVKMARAFAEAGYHKQIVNRLLEPFSHITVVCSSTNWSNFLALRDHPDAEPHIQLLAREIRKALDGAVVQELQPGEWHLPFVNITDEFDEPAKPSGEALTNAMKLSVARCASTSYKTVDGFDMTIERAVVLVDKLLNSNPMHASPFEHQAQADEVLGDEAWGCFMHAEQHGNFKGFRQWRKMLPGECQ
jgi:hypothetical protein